MFHRCNGLKIQELDMLDGEEVRSITPATALDAHTTVTHSSVTPQQSVHYPSVSCSNNILTSNAQLMALSHSIMFPSSKYISTSPPEAHRQLRDSYRFTSETVEASKFSDEPQRVVLESYRPLPLDSERFELQRIKFENDIYQQLPPDLLRTNPVDLQRVHESSLQLSTSPQRAVLDIHRFQSDPQRFISESMRPYSSVSPVHVSESNNSSNTSYRIISESGRLFSESLRNVSEHSGIRTIADAQRMVQESLKDCFPHSHHIISEDDVRSPENRVMQDDIRCTSTPSHSNTILHDTLRYGHDMTLHRGIVPDSIRITEIPHHLVPENLRVVPSHAMLPENMHIDSDSTLAESVRLGAETPNSGIPENLCITTDASHSLIPENLHLNPEDLHVRIGENMPLNVSSHSRSQMSEDLRISSHTSQNCLPENLRIGTETHSRFSENLVIGTETHMPENLHVNAGTSHIMIHENIRLAVDSPHMMPQNLRVSEASRIVPENLHITGSSHELLPENLHISPESLSHETDSHLLRTPQSPLPLLRPSYEHHINRINCESDNAMRDSHRAESPRFANQLYRSDMQYTNSVPPAPPTPAPSVPPMPDPSTTPQYFPGTFTTQVSFNDMETDRIAREVIPVDSKLDRIYQDVKYEQNFTLPVHLSPQDLPVSSMPKPSKVKKPKEPKTPRMPIIHKCAECERTFKNSTQLKNHMWRHTGEKPFSCEECGSKFTQQGNLRAHRRIHTGERPYECSECKNSFTQLSTLKTHQKIHSDERPYKCSQCDAAFRQIANLKTHQVTHTGERPHKCDECDKAFTQKSNLKAHKNRVHSGGVLHSSRRGRRKNPCAIKFYSCLECGAKFTILSNLKIHMKLHTGDKPFECDYCGAGFAQRSNLKTHVQRMHGKSPGHGKRKVKCDECPAMFRLKRCLKLHKKKRHPIKSLKIKLLMESRCTDIEEDGFDDDCDEDDEEDDYDDGNEDVKTEDADENIKCSNEDKILLTEELKVEPVDQPFLSEETAFSDIENIVKEEQGTKLKNHALESPWNYSLNSIKNEAEVDSDELYHPSAVKSKDLPVHSSFDS